jgi:hypothetical protein
MTTFFWILWIIDLLVWIICVMESFASSNKSMAIPMTLLTLCLGLSWWFRNSNPKWALAIAGIPAGLVVLFVLFWLVSMFFRTDWK